MKRKESPRWNIRIGLEFLEENQKLSDKYENGDVIRCFGKKGDIKGQNGHLMAKFNILLNFRYSLL